MMGGYLDQALSLTRQHAADPYPHLHPSQPLGEAVWRTLIGDRTLSARPAPASCGQTVRTMSTFLRTVEELDPGFGDAATFLTSESPSRIRNLLGFTPERQEELRRALSKFSQFEFLFDFGVGSVTFMFCVTEKGYVAMVPHASEPGDTMCLVFGVGTPVVLRATRGDDVAANGDQYQLVGDAYIHGVMDGEALGRGERRVFRLV